MKHFLHFYFIERLWFCILFNLCIDELNAHSCYILYWKAISASMLCEKEIFFLFIYFYYIYYLFQVAVVHFKSNNTYKKNTTLVDYHYTTVCDIRFECGCLFRIDIGMYVENDVG